MTEDLVEKARDLDSLKESPSKDKVFIVEDYDYLNDKQSVFLDLRDGFNIYGYDGYGDQLQVDKRKIPQEVKDLEKIYRAEGSQQIGEFL
jgi:hypothetical protein